MFELKALELDVVVAEWHPNSLASCNTTAHYAVIVNCRGKYCAGIRLCGNVEESFRECFQRLSEEAAEHALDTSIPHVRTKACSEKFIESRHNFTRDGGWEAAFQVDPEYVKYLNREGDLSFIGAACEAMSYESPHGEVDEEWVFGLLKRVCLQKYKDWGEFFEHESGMLIPGKCSVDIDIHALPDFEQLKAGRLVFDGKLVGSVRKA